MVMTAVLMLVGLQTGTPTKPQVVPPPTSQPAARPAQAPNAKPNEHDEVQAGRRALAKAVRQAHRDDAPLAKIDRYRATLKVRTLGNGKEGNVDLTLDVLYGAAIERRASKTMQMVRYTLKEQGKPLLQGRDERGYWHMIGDRVDSLSSRNQQASREVVEQRLRLCNMMLRFLNPGAILGALRGTAPVRESTIKLLGRKHKKPVAAQYVDGLLTDFPIYRGGKDYRTAKVWMEAWVEKTTSRLMAVKVYPIGKDKRPDWRRGEFIQLGGYVRKDGVLLPCDLTFFEMLGEKRKPVVSVNIQKFDLNPMLSKADFRRPMLKKRGK